MQLHPPYNLEAEARILGACLRSVNAVNDSVLRLTPMHFFTQEGKDIFLIIKDLYDRDLEISPNSVLSLLPESPNARKFLLDSFAIGSVFADLSPFIQTLQDCLTKRSLLDLSASLLQEAQKPSSNAQELIKHAQESLSTASDGTSKKTLLTALEYIDDPIPFIKDYQNKQEQFRRGEKVIPGIPTGYLDLDKHIQCYCPGHLVIIGARPGVGKTTMAVNLLANLQSQKVPTLFFSLEMPGKELIQKLLCRLASLDYRKLQDGSGDGQFFQSLLPAYEYLKQNPTSLFDDQPSLLIDQIRARTLRAKRSLDIKVVFIDYIQLIRSNSRGTDVRHLEIADISRKLKEMAKELEITVVALAQVNRESEKRVDKRPFLTDLRESGALEADGDEILLLHRPDMFDPHDKPGLMEVLIRKNRLGALDNFYLNFEKAKGILTNYSFKTCEPLYNEPQERSYPYV